jgi:hypothetical protein
LIEPGAFMTSTYRPVYLVPPCVHFVLATINYFWSWPVRFRESHVVFGQFSELKVSYELAR